jgi:tetrahydromethanopterin S-methyltransferase subunit B
MAGVKITSLIEARAQVIEAATAQVIAEIVLPLQQRIDRLRKDVDDLMRERGSPPEQVAEPKAESSD